MRFISASGPIKDNAGFLLMNLLVTKSTFSEGLNGFLSTVAVVYGSMGTEGHLLS